MIATNRYAPVAQAFHWLSAILVLLAWTLGVSYDALPKEGESREIAEFVHMLAGQAIVALLILRLVWRVIAPAPRAATALGPVGDTLGKLAHILLYALLFAVPATGLVTLFLGGEALPLAGVVDIASPWPRSRELKHYAKEIHEALAHALMLLALLHGTAAAVHHFVLKDDVLRRMLPQ